MKRRRSEPEKVNRFGMPDDLGGFWWGVYDRLAAIGIPAVRLAGLFHKKLGEAVKGRSGGVNGWRIEVFDDRPSILIHTASRGEFEAACPLIEALQARGDCRVAVSFSSPSVEGVVRSYGGLWACGYLPFDSLGEQLRFLSRLEPTLILVAKHDIWPNMIRAASSLRIPVMMLNANFHTRTKRQLPFVRSFNRQFLSLMTQIWAVSKDDAARIRPLLSRKVSLKVVGDTRYDRTLFRAEQGRVKFKALKEALGPGPVIVAGSTWPPEEKIVFRAFSQLKLQVSAAKLVIAPHEPGTESVERCRRAGEENGLSTSYHSAWSGSSIETDVYYIDRMGILADVYSVGWAAIVGGGFGVGVHSVLEPASYGIPVAFGPNCHVSHEAGLLLKSAGGSLLTDSESLLRQWKAWLESETEYLKVAKAAHNVVLSNAGATERVIDLLEPYLQRS